MTLDMAVNSTIDAILSDEMSISITANPQRSVELQGSLASTGAVG